MLVGRNSKYKRLLQRLESNMILQRVEDAINDLEGNQNIERESSKLIIFVMTQWLIAYMCKRLMQLMTPEALVTNYKKIPNFYVKIYLKFQSHFSLTNLIKKYYSSLQSYR